jgi:hypothetical protein
MCGKRTLVPRLRSCLPNPRPVSPRDRRDREGAARVRSQVRRDQNDLSPGGMAGVDRAHNFREGQSPFCF